MRETPHNFEVEQTLLGTVLANNSAYHRISETVRPEYFAEPLHGKLFSTIATLIEKGQVATPVTLKTYFEADPDLQAGGGPRYLARLVTSSMPAQDAPTYADQVKDLYLRRKLIELANEAADGAYARSVTDDAVQQIENLERGLFVLADAGQSQGRLQDFHGEPHGRGSGGRRCASAVRRPYRA